MTNKRIEAFLLLCIIIIIIYNINLLYGDMYGLIASYFGGLLYGILLLIIKNE